MRKRGRKKKKKKKPKKRVGPPETKEIQTSQQKIILQFFGANNCQLTDDVVLQYFSVSHVMEVFPPDIFVLLASKLDVRSNVRLSCCCKAIGQKVF
jgi:hypothetical protein